MSRKHIAFSLATQPFILLFIALFLISPVLAQSFEVNVSTSKGGELPGVKVYAFTESGSYTGRSATTDGSGTALFDSANFADGAYKFRVDYLGNRFWSQVITMPGAFAVAVAITEETVEVTVTMGAGPAVGVRVYLFSETGSYLNVYKTTDPEGVVQLDLPVEKSFKFRADILGGQYWSDIVSVSGGGVNHASVAAGGGLLHVTLEEAPGSPMAGIKVYLFSQSGTYLSLYGVTDGSGGVGFTVPEGVYKVRADYLGYRFWSEEAQVMDDAGMVLTIPHQPVEVSVLSVFQGASQPMEKLKVYLFSSSGSYLGQYQQTDAEGKVTFNLPEKAYRVRADYLGQQFWCEAFIWENVTIEAPMADAEITVVGAGFPRDGVKVYLFSAVGSYLSLYDTTDNDGKAAFRIPEGTYKFRADYLGSRFWSPDSLLAKDQTNTINISTGGGAFTVTVHKDAGVPIEGVKCYVFDASDAYLGMFGATDGNGDVSFDLADGAYKFRVDYLGGRFWSDLAAVPDVSMTEVIIQEERVEATVVTSAGPVEGIRVYLFSENKAYLGIYKVTDENGLVSFDLPAGKIFKFRADILGEESWSDPVTVSSGGVNNVSINAGGGLLQVTVEKAAGSAMEGIKVYLFSQSGSYLGLHDLTDVSGVVGFHVPRGTFKVRADYLGYQFWSAETPVTEDAATVLTIPHQPVDIGVLGVFQEISSPIEGIKAYLFSSAGSYLGRYQLTDADGKVAFDLPEKAYKVRADYLGQQFWSEVFTWGETSVNVPMADAEITVTGGGVPRKGAKIYVFSDIGSYLSLYDTTDNGGKAIFRIPEGVYKFRADEGGDQYWSALIAVAADQVNPVTIDMGVTPITVSISADPESIEVGETSILTWSSTDADSAVIDHEIGVVEPNGSIAISPAETTTYTITATGPGGTASAEVTVTVVHPEPDVSISADPESIEVGETSILTWSSTDAESCVIEPGIGTVDVSGSISVSPTETTTYSVTATGPGGTGTAAVTVVVATPTPVVVLTAEPETIQPGGASTLEWTSTHADTCVIEPGIGSVDATGSITVSLTETTPYTITATGPGGTAAATAVVTVIEIPYAPAADISADPATIPQGESTLLSWTVTHADATHIDNGIGVVSVEGSVLVSPQHTTTYTITATGSGGSGNARVTVMVTGDPGPQPEGSFGEQYEGLTPPDATVAEYDPKRFSVITGLVVSMDDSPVSGVSVTVHHHPEYGTALTDAEGRFSIPVEGGGTLTIRYYKEGLISSQGQVYVPWNDIALCETLQMIAEDPESTTLTLDGDSGTVVTHRSTEVTDEFGSRSCSLVFQGDNRAYAADDDGNEMFELDTINVRATEFTKKDAMPAQLPPNSAYTYCVELSVDGVRNVVFEDPVVTWVDNFLGFDVGIAVPVGYYDRAKGVWVPSDNGVVVRLLDENGDGRVDALDSDGDDLPDDLNQNGTYDDEVTGLDDPSRYLPGDTFWRVRVSHFSPFDFNWPFGPDGDAESPNPDGVPDSDQSSSEEQPCTTSAGSFVEDRSRIFHEDVPVPGTDMTLHYESSRVDGYKTIIKVPASGDTVPESLKGIMVEVYVAGRKFTRELAPLPNQMAEISWDGLDSMGNRVLWTIPAKVGLGFVYDAVYYNPGDFDQAFAKYGCSNYLCPMGTVRARQELVLWQIHEITIRTERPGHGGIMGEGWTLSAHHFLDLASPNVLFKGDGATIDSLIKIMETVAGNGNIGFGGDGGPAIQASFSYPMGVALDQAGNIFISDTWNHHVRKVDTEGIITTVAGNGFSGYAGDDGPAIDASLSYPWGIAVDSTGNLYIADFGNNCIRRVDTEGIITTVAGNGSSGYGGDDELAIDASLSGPKDVALDEWGNIYIADTDNNRIRKVDPNGIITTVVGDGSGGYDGDGGPAVEASIRNPQGVAVFEGAIFIGDTFNSRIRRVDTSGIITTVAGNGTFGFAGDGGPAHNAILNSPTDVVPDKSGNIYIADFSNARVRKVDTNGNIITVAGNGVQDFVEDGLPATQSPLEDPFSMAFDGAGNLFILDELGARLFRVNASSELPISIADYLEGDNFIFAEENGQGHLISSSGRHEATVDLVTGVALRTFEYNGDHQLVAISDPFGNRTIIERKADGTPTAIVSPDGLTTTLTLDAQKHLTAVTYPDAGAYHFEYTVYGLMTVETEPNGNRFEHQFDADGRLTDVLDQEGGHWHFDRIVFEDGDVAAQVTSGEGNQTTYWDHTDSTGRFTSTIIAADDSETQYERSTDGLTVYKWLPCGMSLGFSYDVDPLYKFKYIGEMVEITPSDLSKTTLREKSYQDTDSDGYADFFTETVEVNGKTTLLQQNILASNKTIKSPEGRVVTTTYDPDTLLTTAVSIPGLFDTDYGYDTRGRLTSITNNTRQTSFTYNGQGFLGSVTDPENHTTTYAYDPVGRVTGISRPDGSSLGFADDPNGNMTVLTNPADISHLFGYNKVNLSSAYQTPLSGTYAYVYDKDRRLVRTDFPSGYQIQNVYDKNRLIQSQTPEGNINLTYLCGTKVGSIAKGTESISYTYDGKLMTSETLAGTLNQTLSYGYNIDFDLQSFTYGGNTESYAYDDDGLLTGAGAFTISRNAGNGLPEGVAGGALDLTRSFNGYGEVAQESYRVGGQNVSSWNLTRDDSGRITRRIETVEGVTSTRDYIYDPMGRLLTVTKDGTLVEEYEYGLTGSRISETNTLRGISGKTFAYSDGDHLLTAGDVTYQYDVDGFLYTRTQGTDVTTYIYSSRGELLSVTLPDGTLIEYLHDPLGRRIAKKVNGAVSEKYLWQGMTRLLAVYDGSDNLVMRFQYADGRMPYAMTKSGSTYYLSYDQVGTLRVVADAYGNVVKRIDYDSFGNVILDTEPSREILFGFAGGLYDVDTGLVRFGYRDYDPDIGRWTAKDPILFAGGDTDLYGYCLNDPVNWVDKDGLQNGRVPFNPELTPGEPGMPGGGGYNPSVPDPNIGLDPSSGAFENLSSFLKRLSEGMYHPKTGSDLFEKIRPKPKKDHPCK